MYLQWHGQQGWSGPYSGKGLSGVGAFKTVPIGPWSDPHHFLSGNRFGFFGLLEVIDYVQKLLLIYFRLQPFAVISAVPTFCFRLQDWFLIVGNKTPCSTCLSFIETKFDWDQPKPSQQLTRFQSLCKNCFRSIFKLSVYPPMTLILSWVYLIS